jgi:hypothetical protein
MFSLICGSQTYELNVYIETYIYIYIYIYICVYIVTEREQNCISESILSVLNLVRVHTHFNF